MNEKKGRLLTGTLCAVLLAAVAGLPASADDSGVRHRGNDRIEGLWNVKVWLTNCVTGETLPFPAATFDAMGMFSGDGTFHDTNANNPITRSSAFGTWERIGKRTYRFAFRLFRFDTTGFALGSQIVRHTVSLSADGESYTSKGGAEFFDTNGIRMMPDGCSRSTATRFE